MELREYIVTLKDRNDLESFYEDMETLGGDLYIPNRKVDVLNRRPLSRNTHYMLTDVEAENLRNYSKVLAVELTPEDRGLIVKPFWEQTSSYWDKSSTVNNQHKNWGLLRSIEGIQRSGWGSGTLDTKTQTATIKTNADGKNVDVVIVDGHINVNHPEFAVNSDGTGGTRVVQYNWFIHNLSVQGISATNYVYDTNDNSDNNHGMHVAGTVAGNTQGWARQANIYNLSPYSTNPNTYMYSSVLFDYIRAWHNSKPINPLTGRKNPTICNNSWGFIFRNNISNITQVYRRGVNYTTNLTSSELNNLGVINNGTTTENPARNISTEVDVQDAILDGIIMIGAAGNYSHKIDVTTGEDYNNFYVVNSLAYYYNRGMAPTVGSDCICVGAIDTVSSESKATFSNCGPRVDVYAPGRRIMSSLISGGVSDSRNTSYFLSKYSGTSMASPQVTGVLACMAELYPNMNQEDARNYIISRSKINQIYDTGGSASDYTSLQGSPNRFLYYFNERTETSILFPRITSKARPTTGSLYPRIKVRR